MTLALRALARRQHGIFTHRQAIHLGMFEVDIVARLASCDWVIVHPGVYACAGTRLTPMSHAWAATLAVGPPIALYGRWAAWVHQLDRAPAIELPVQVVVPERRRGDTVEGVDIVRTRQRLQPVLAQGLPAVPPARALRQLCAEQPRGRVRDMLHHALRRRVLTLPGLTAELGRGLHGAAILRELLTEVAPGYQVVWEGVLHRELETLGIHLEPEVRVAVASGYRLLDLGDDQLRFGVEVDGFLTHLDRFADDRRRDRELTSAGWLMVHVAVSELVDNLRGVALEIANAYRRRQAELRAAAGGGQRDAG